MKNQIPIKKIESEILFEISIIVTKKDNLPQLELRRRTSDNETIKTIINCALHNQPIIVLPSFKNKLMSLNSLVKNGIIYYDTDDGAYYFNI